MVSYTNYYIFYNFFQRHNSQIDDLIFIICGKIYKEGDFMYNSCHTSFDSMKEFLITGAELDGKYQDINNNSPEKGYFTIY